MRPEQDQRVENLLRQMRGLSSEEQSALLNEHCADDPQLRAAVEARLAASRAPTKPAEKQAPHADETPQALGRLKPGRSRSTVCMRH